MVEVDAVYIEEEDWPFDYRQCAYYRRYYRLPGHDPNGICSFGCQEEPSCVTSGREP